MSVVRTFNLDKNEHPIRWLLNSFTDGMYGALNDWLASHEVFMDCRVAIPASRLKNIETNLLVLVTTGIKILSWVPLRYSLPNRLRLITQSFPSVPKSSFSMCLVLPGRRVTAPMCNYDGPSS